MKRIVKLVFIYWMVSFCFLSCVPNRNLTYFNNLSEVSDYKIPIKNFTEPIIQTNDLLSITVNTLSAESNTLFNSGVIQDNINPANGTNSNNINAPVRRYDGYLVDNDGNINFPVLGKVKLAGLTREEAIDKVTEEIKKSVKNPIVNIRFLNFQITVIGEVNRPSTFTVPTEKVNVLEALGFAGDMTPYGKREHVLVIREKAGVRSVTKIDFTNKDLLSSPSFYLQQHDVVYVEPVKARVFQGSSTSYYLPIISTLASLISILVFALK